MLSHQDKTRPNVASGDQARSPSSFSIPRKPVPVHSTVSQPPSIHHDDSVSSISSSGQAWRPAVTHRRVLLALLTCFALMLSTLEVLAFISRRNQGLVPATLNRYYLWTYGPTAVLAIFVALWSRVNYRIRQMAPWNVMAQSRTTGRKSISLDYVSAPLLKSIYQAIKNKNLVVAVSAIISVLLIILVIPSTGLFALGVVPVTLSHINYTTTSKFYDPSSEFFESSGFYATYILNAIDMLGLSYPSGTTAEFAYQPFLSSDLPPGAIQQAKVDIMTYDLDCEPAELIVDEWSYSWECGKDLYGPGVSSRTTLSTSDCTFIGIADDTVYFTYGLPGDVQKFASFALRQCEGAFSWENSSRIALVVGQAQQSGIGDQPVEECVDTSSTIANINLLNSKQWLCKIDMATQKGTVTFNATALALGAVPEIAIDAHSERRPLSGYARYSMVEAMTTSNRESNWTFDDQRSFPAFLEESNMDPNSLAVLRGQDINLDDFLGTDTFVNLTLSFYKRISAQLTRQYLTLTDSSAISGDAILNTNRLVIQPVPLRLMGAILAVLTVLVAILILKIPTTPVVPRDPSTLIGLATLLRLNDDIRHSFRGTGSYKEAELEKMSASREYSLQLSSENFGFTTNHMPKCFHLMETRQQDTIITQTDEKESLTLARWWRPLVTTKRIRFLASFIVLVVIVALQVILLYSTQHDGLANVDGIGYIHMAWSLFPASVMVFIALYYDALASAYKIFTPYCRLSATSTARKSLFVNYLALTDIELLWSALRNRDFAMVAVAFSTILTAFLTIVVSGVFTAQPVPASSEVILRQTTSFISNGSDDIGLTGSNAVIAGLIIEANLSYPQWTYDDLVISSVELDQGDNKSSFTESNAWLRAQIPAIRSSLNCTFYGKDDIPDAIYYPPVPGSTENFVRAKFPGPIHCAGEDSQIIGWYPEANGIFARFVNNTIDGCPFLNYFWGAINEVEVTYVAALSCYEIVEMVEVEMTFSMPDFSIDTNNPPRALEETAARFSDAAIPTTYMYLPQPYGVAGIDWTGLFLGISTRDNIPVSEFGSSGKSRDIGNAIQKLHRLIRAQQYHAVLREPASNEIRSKSLPGVLTNSESLRLVQNPISTHILTGMLSMILISSLVASYLVSTKKVLPKNPCSVAAMISLIADSNIFERKILPEGIEWMSNTELEKKGVLDGLLFKMGWADRSENGQRVFTIDIVDHEQSRPMKTG